MMRFVPLWTTRTWVSPMFEERRAPTGTTALQMYFTALTDIGVWGKTA